MFVKRLLLYLSQNHSEHLFFFIIAQPLCLDKVQYSKRVLKKTFYKSWIYSHHLQNVLFILFVIISAKLFFYGHQLIQTLSLLRPQLVIFLGIAYRDHQTHCLIQVADLADLVIVKPA